MFKNATAMNGRSSDFKSWKAVMLIAVLILSVFCAVTVVDSDDSDAAASVSVSPKNITVYENGSSSQKTKTVTVTVDKGGVDAARLEVTSSDSTKVRVSSESPSISGTTATFTVTGVGVTTTEVTITVKLKDTGAATDPSDTVKVTVKKIVKSVKIVDSSGKDIPDKKLSMQTGKTAEVKATINPAEATDPTVKWTSDNEKAVTVVNGKLTAVGAGTAKITIEANDESKAKDSITVTVEDIKVTGVTLEVVGEPSVKIKSKITLIATIMPADATHKEIDISIERSDLLKVDSKTTADNKVTYVLEATGDTTTPANVKVTVTTKDQQKTASVSIKVERIPVTGITLTPKSIEIEMDDKDKKLEGKTVPVNATVDEIIWASSDPSVATVDTTGKITPVKVGYTTITATTKEGGFKAECLVTVTNNITIDLVASQDSQGNAILTDTQVTNTITEINKLVANKQYPLIAIDAGFSYNLTIQSNLVKAIQDANGSQLYADFLLGEVLFDADAVDSIDTSGKTVGISFTEVDESKYPKFGACYIYDISILKDGNKIETNFGSDRAEIAIYHDLKTGEDKDKLLAAYVIREDYGLKIKDASVITDGDWDESAVVIKAPHMSLFMFMFHESEYVKTAGIDTVIAIVFLVIIVILAAGIAFFTFNENASEKLQNLFKRNNTKRPPMSPPGQNPYGYYPGNQFNGYGNNYNNYNNNNGNNNYR